MGEGRASGTRTPSERVEADAGGSALADAADAAWRWTVALWVRLVGGLLWGVVGFQVGLALDAARVPVARTAGDLIAGLPITVAPGTASACPTGADCWRSACW